MTVTDIASRTYNHGWRLDPIVRSLLDTWINRLDDDSSAADSPANGRESIPIE